MFVAATSIEPPAKVAQQPGPPKKNYYIVNTFVSQTSSLVDEAVDFYYQKYKIFIQLADSRLQQEFASLYRSNITFKDAFQRAYNTYSTQIASHWTQIQSTSTQQLSPNIQAFNNYTRALQSAGETQLDLRDVLQQLSQGAIINYSSIPGTVDLNSIHKLLDSFSKKDVNNVRSIAGARSRLMGEIFEQGANSILAEGTHQLLGYMQVGGVRSLLPGGTVGYGKSDGMFFATSMDGGLTTLPNKASVTKNHQIELEASKLFDLDDGGAQQAIAQYANLNDFRGGMLGTTVKAWIGNTGTFGSFSPTAKIINNRQIAESSNGEISEWFSELQDFKAYNSYIVAKYLINIIGVYNGIIITGNEMMPTYQWLQNLYNSFRTIRHVNSIKESKETSRGSGRKYWASNKLVIANM